MTDDVQSFGASGDAGGPVGGQPAATPPVWPQPFPGTAPTPAPWVPAPAWQTPATPAPAPVGGPVSLAKAPTAAMPASAPAAPTAAPWAVGVPVPRPPVANPPPAAYAQPLGTPYGGGYAGPPSVAPPLAPASPGPGRRGAGRGALIALALVLVAGLAGGGTWFVLRQNQPAPVQHSTTFGAPLDPQNNNGPNSGGGASVSSAPPSASLPTTSAPATPTAMSESQALAELQNLRAASVAGLVTDDRWIAQVASKSVGITDPLQTTESGSHTFLAVDILKESQAVLQKAPASAVLVLQSTDFGKRSYARDGQAYWITAVDLGFGSSDQVKSWCASAFAGLTAEQLADTCVPRTLSPPHD